MVLEARVKLKIENLNSLKETKYEKMDRIVYGFKFDIFSWN
jgi:hypothetical protein